MEYILALFLSAIFTFVYISLRKRNIHKSKVVKKEELVQAYRLELLDILEKYEDNQDELLQEKIKFLKRVNFELSMNIFFEKEEAKELLQELSNLGKR